MTDSEKLRAICVSENVKVGALKKAIVRDFLIRYNNGDRAAIQTARDAGKKAFRGVASDVLTYISKNPDVSAFEIPIKDANVRISKLVKAGKIYISGHKDMGRSKKVRVYRASHIAAMSGDAE